MKINVKDGTGAGSRVVVHLANWRCGCGIDHPGHHYSCAGCGVRRPA